MEPIITPEIVVAYSQCPRKAYLLLFSPDKGEPHEYMQILEQQRYANQERYIEHLRQIQADVHPYSLENLRKGSEVLINARLQVDGFAADCGVLTKVEGTSTFGKYNYEPSIFVGTHSISKEQQLELSSVGSVLERLQHKSPAAGRIIGMDGKSHIIKLNHYSKDLRPLLEPLHEWITVDAPTPPPIVLNKHCPLCPFQRLCHAQAEQEDNLSLLNGVTARVMRQYEKKGIFTVKQLSYLFKPRKRRKGSRKSSPVTHKVELQALAIRENKIYLQELPTLSRQPVELFVDIEGVPDRGRYYLIGVSVCQGDTTEHHAFWADTDQDEQDMWQQFVGMVTQYPEAPMYHYGSYELRAITTLAKRYHSDAQSVLKRLVNVNGYIYGKVYFPVRSNRLKELGAFIGAKWTSPEASGLQSLVWRHYWEATQEETHKDLLLNYNAEDCHALRLLTEALSKIQHASDTLSEVDFAHQPKQHATEVGEQVHRQFTAILKFAHADYDKKKISFRPTKDAESEQPRHQTKPRAHKGYHGPRNTKHKATKVVEVPQETFCPKHQSEPLLPTASMSKRRIIDLVLEKNGIRKTITEYVGVQGYCPKCSHQYAPSSLKAYGISQVYGHGFRAWNVYQRVALRMPYEGIVELMAEQFHEHIPATSLLNFIRDFACSYATTEESLTQRLLASPFVHADETPVNIRGVNHYVWVFTDGQSVVFQFTETREATIAHQFFADYHGVLISDFYPGYDAVPCRQQKCWVHLIRDLNDDLWAAPFDAELETFILEVRNLIVPIMEAIQKYGLKKRHLHTFQKQVARFYAEVILDHPYHSELALKYQKRFIQYRASLFTFLEHDGIPWENNTAERALRHLTVQEKISGSFHKSLMPDYLRLLAIRQTCRFQGKSFFKFLFSGETDLDKFEARKRKR